MKRWLSLISVTIASRRRQRPHFSCDCAEDHQRGRGGRVAAASAVVHRHLQRHFCSKNRKLCSGANKVLRILHTSAGDTSV